MDTARYDSLIFDMDGTLWDAVDSYCAIWNKTFEEYGINAKPVSREMLVSMMGTTLDKIIDKVLPEVSGDNRFIERLIENEQEMMPRLGGRLYNDVTETVSTLAKKYPLFMVSNCSKNGLRNFLEFTKLKPFISDTLSNGDTGLGKADNIATIVRRHNLKSPLYVGDTQSDCDSCVKAGVDFVWASYGFGHVDNPKYTLSKFSDLLKIVH